MRVKHFVETARYSPSSQEVNGDYLDDLINKWLSENPKIRVVGIKYAGNVSYTASDGASGSETNYSALLVYEEVADE